MGIDKFNLSKDIINKVLENGQKNSNLKTKRKKRDKSDLGTDFVAPDGGWGWIICLACGLSTLFMQAPLQQYGLLYRQRLFKLGLDNKQIITIINTHMAAAKLTGIIHGPLYRWITYRKAAIIGSSFIFIGVISTAFCKNFLQYLFFFSIIYGFGMGINLSAVTLAVNTYFKKHRRRATGLSASLTGIGPILLPHLVTLTLKDFGQNFVIILMAALTLHCFVCAFTLQPVLWHVKKEKRTTKSVDVEKKTAEKLEELNEKQIKTVNSSDSVKGKQAEKPQTLSQETNQDQKETSINTLKDPKNNLKARIITFFDLDLLKDLKFLNIIQGISIMMFSELNFSVLTPFILGSFDYTNEQISLLMSLLAGVDIVVRFIAPFLLEKVKFSNRFLFACGIIIISIGRFLVTLNNSYYAMLSFFLLIGFGKAFRTVFFSLIIPSHVPLNRLPAAAGLQSVFETIFSLACGPLLGVIVDASNYTVAIHVLNAFTTFSLLLWFTEWLICKKFLKKGSYDLP